MTEWIQKYVDHLSTKKTQPPDVPRLSSESQQIFEAKQKIQLYMMRGAPDLDDTESESSEEHDYNDFLVHGSEDESIKDSGFIDSFITEKAINKDVLPNKVDRMLLPLFTDETNTGPMVPRNSVSVESAVPTDPLPKRLQSYKSVETVEPTKRLQSYKSVETADQSVDPMDPYEKFGAISVEASKVQVGRRNTVNDDLKNIFQALNKSNVTQKASRPSTSEPFKKHDKHDKHDDSVKNSIRSGTLYNTLQAEFVKSQYKPRWTESTIEMISEASQTDLGSLGSLPPGYRYSHDESSSSNSAPPNSLLSLANMSEEALNEPASIANNVRLLLQAAKDRNVDIDNLPASPMYGDGLVHKQKAVNDDLKDLFKLIKCKESSSQTNTMTESDKTSNESVRISVGSSIAGIYDTLNAEFKTQYKPKWTGSSLESVPMSHQLSQTDNFPPLPSEDSHDFAGSDLKEVFPSFSRVMKNTSFDETPAPMWTESQNTMDVQYDASHTEIMTTEAVYCSNLSIDSMPWVPFPSKSTSLNENSLKVHLSGASSIIATDSLDSSRGRSLIDNSASTQSSVSTQTESKRRLRIVSKVKLRGSPRQRDSKDNLLTSPRHHKDSKDNLLTSPRHERYSKDTMLTSPRHERLSKGNLLSSPRYHRDSKGNLLASTRPQSDSTGTDGKQQAARRSKRDSIEVYNIRKSQQYKRSSLATHNNHRQVTKFVERVIANAVEQEELELVIEASSCASSSYPDTISLSPTTSQDLGELDLEDDEEEEYANSKLNSAYQKFKELLEIQQEETRERERERELSKPREIPKLDIKEETQHVGQHKEAPKVRMSEGNEPFWDRVKQPLLETISPRLNGNTVVVSERLKPGMLHTLQISSSFNHPGIVVEECWLYWRVTAILTYGSIECDGRVSVGDVVFAVNGLSVRGTTKGKIRQLFYQCSKQEDYSISVLAFDERWGGYNATMAQVKELLRSKDMPSLNVTPHPTPTPITHHYPDDEPSSSSHPAPTTPHTPKTVDVNVQRMDLDVFIKNAFYSGPGDYRS